MTTTTRATVATCAAHGNPRTVLLNDGPAVCFACVAALVPVARKRSEEEKRCP